MKCEECGAEAGHLHSLEIGNYKHPDGHWEPIILEVCDSCNTKGSKKEPVIATKIGRNDPCPCGSDKKYKKCHG